MSFAVGFCEQMAFAEHAKRISGLTCVATHMIDMSNERYSRELIGVLAGSGFRISMECGYREVVWQLNFMKRSSRYVLMERLRPWGSLVITVPR